MEKGTGPEAAVMPVHFEGRSGTEFDDGGSRTRQHRRRRRIPRSFAAQPRPIAAGRRARRNAGSALRPVLTE